jgi:DNA-binding IclR family transcriptional regulator
MTYSDYRLEASAVPRQKDNNVKSASRAFDVLEFVARSSTAPSFVDLCKALSIPKSSMFNMLSTLIDREYLQFADERQTQYKIGPMVTELAAGARKAESLTDRARPLLKVLSDVLNETTGYYERRGDHVECLATETGKQSLTYTMNIGDRVRLYGNSSGKAILASLSERELDHYLKTAKFIPYTPKTLGSAAAVRSEVVKIRKSGIAKAAGDYLPGITAFAVAVYDGDTLAGAISVAVPDIRFTKSLEEKIISQLNSVKRRFADQ